MLEKKWRLSDRQGNGSSSYRDTFWSHRGRAERLQRRLPFAFNAGW
jgi:hypothetical protein